LQCDVTEAFVASSRRKQSRYKAEVKVDLRRLHVWRSGYISARIHNFGARCR